MNSGPTGSVMVLLRIWLTRVMAAASSFHPATPSAARVARGAGRPERRTEAPVEHPADRQLDDPPVETITRQLIELANSREVPRKTRRLEFRVGWDRRARIGQDNLGRACVACRPRNLGDGRLDV